MRSLIVADEAFVIRERSLLARLLVGLADEGVRVMCAIPQRLVERINFEVLVPIVGYEHEGVVFSRPARVDRFMEALEGSDREGARFDIVHVFGGSSWGFALDVARRLGALTILEVWRPGLADRARALRSSHQRVAFFAPAPGIERLLLKEGGGLTVRLTPWGVRVTKVPNPILRPGRAASITLVGSGRSHAHILAAFDGTCRAIKTHENAMLFVDSDAARRAGVWKLARHENLVHRVSIVDAVEERRDLIIRSDILLYPEARGEQRTVLLEAMGAGMAVIARADPMIAALVPDVTARVLQDPSAETWQAEVARLLDEPDAARALGRTARERIQSDFRATTHIRSVLDGYEWLLSSQSIPLAFSVR